MSALPPIADIGRRTTSAFDCPFYGSTLGSDERLVPGLRATRARGSLPHPVGRLAKAQALSRWGRPIKRECALKFSAALRASLAYSLKSSAPRTAAKFRRAHGPSKSARSFHQPAAETGGDGPIGSAKLYATVRQCEPMADLRAAGKHVREFSRKCLQRANDRHRQRHADVFPGLAHVRITSTRSRGRMSDHCKRASSPGRHPVSKFTSAKARWIGGSLSSAARHFGKSFVGIPPPGASSLLKVTPAVGRRDGRDGIELVWRCDSTRAKLRRRDWRKSVRPLP